MRHRAEPSTLGDSASPRAVTGTPRTLDIARSLGDTVTASGDRLRFESTIAVGRLER